ncbi:MAG: diguanylate cyclase [Pseudomonadales bacterium]|nr:diguanylate cyclase [Pseudomonadales bacterium]MCP5184502.1 diguanylate cyclase [Pseudomonadales bacterium]
MALPETTLNYLLLLPPAVATILALSVARVAAVRRPARGWRQLVACAVGAAWWCFLQIPWVLADSPDAARWIARLQYLAILTVPVLWTQFTLAQIGRVEWLRWPRVAAFFLVPGLVLACAFEIGPGSALIWQSIAILPGQPVPRITYGPLYLLVIAHAYLLTLIACSLLMFRYMESPHYRRQLVVILVLPLVLLMTNLLYVLGKWPLPTDPTPLAFAAAFALMLWAMLRHRLHDLVPLARGMAFDSLDEGVLLLNSQGAVVDANAAAGNLLNRETQSLIGCACETVLGGVSADWLLEQIGETHLPVEGETPRLLLPRAVRIRETSSGLHGTVVTLRDVTAERAYRRALEEALQQIELANERLTRLASTDELTGLANRRALLERLDQEVTRAHRHGRRLAFVLLDLDHFKTVNDRHGHLAGDRALVAVAAVLTREIRNNDLAARYGGEELALLLPETTRESALALAWRIAEAIRHIRLVGHKGTEFSVSASFGVAELRADEDGVEAFVARADGALYAAKRDGRDCVRIA